MIADLMGKTVTIDSDEDRLRPEKSEVFRLLADSSKAERLTGWTAEVSLEDGLRQTIEWVLKNRAMFRTGEYTV